MWTLLLSISSSFVLYQVGRVIYNLFFHPLRSYPGPRLWATSRIPWNWVNIHGQLCWTLVDMHRKYGPVVRIAPDELSYTTGTAWEKIYGQRNPEFSKCLDGRGIAPVSRNGNRSIVTESQERHGKLRRAILPAFSDRALREQEYHLKNYASKLVHQLRAISGPQNIVKWYALTTFDIISELAFGEPGTCLDNADQPWLSIISSRARGIVWYELAIYYGFYRFITWLLPGYTVTPQMNHMKLCAAKVNKRLNKTEKLTDFMSYIVDNQTENLSNRDLVFMASAFIVAGSGTSASALSGITFFLLKDKKIYDRLVTEIRTTFAKDEEITVASTSELPYLRACVREGLRMFPPAPSTLPRFVPENGEEIDGQWVKGGVAVGVHQLSSGLVESNFHRPMEFLPERWLELSKDSPFANDKRSAIKPFSYGPRNCVGKNLAHAEIKLILATIIWNFDLELVNNSDDWWKRQKTYLVWDKSSLMVNVHPKRI